MLKLALIKVDKSVLRGLLMATINEQKVNYTFKNGVKDGLPIGLGYLAVSFAFGVRASLLSVLPLISLLISATNLTSAGQLAGLNIIAAAGTFIEIILIQLVINSRYFLMSISLSQKTDNSFTMSKRLFLSAFITDEIFAVAVAKPKQISAKYFGGLALLPYIGWTSGTIIGALAGNVLPTIIISSLGIALYAMFIAIIIPPSTKNLGVFFSVIIAAAINCAIVYIPFLSFISSNFAVIISAIVTSVVCALIFPVKTEVEQ